jgi:hypothetical protein
MEFSPFGIRPVDETPTKLYVKSFSPFGSKDEYFFVNNRSDTAGGTIAYLDALRVPVRDKGDEQPRFSDIRPLLLVEDLEIDEGVVCYRQPTYRDRSRAHFWTPAWLWDLAKKDFVVFRHTPNGRTIKCDQFSGVWELSVRYATDGWDNGVICRVNDSVYAIMEVIADHQGREHYVAVEDDPRLYHDELPKDYRDLSVLPV